MWNRKLAVNIKSEAMTFETALSTGRTEDMCQVSLQSCPKQPLLSNGLLRNVSILGDSGHTRNICILAYLWLTHTLKQNAFSFVFEVTKNIVCFLNRHGCQSCQSRQISSGLWIVVHAINPWLSKDIYKPPLYRSMTTV